MCSYNQVCSVSSLLWTQSNCSQINNSYGCSNSYTQNYLLKGELNFQGFVMSDWGGIFDIHILHEM